METKRPGFRLPRLPTGQQVLPVDRVRNFRGICFDAIRADFSLKTVRLDQRKRHFNRFFYNLVVTGLRFDLSG